MSTIDIQYIMQVSPRLEGFKRKSQNLYNFRCPYCGDSAKKRSKARGYFYRVKNDMFFKCHNCGEGKTVGTFLKDIDNELYKQYVVDRYKGSVSTNVKEPEFEFKPVTFVDKPLRGLKSFENLRDHPAYNIMQQRCIPEEFHSKLYLVNKFYTYVNDLIPNKFPKIENDHPRLLIPFFDANNKMFAFQGRAFGDEQPKYVTVKLDESKRKIYGLERINFQLPIHIVEGPIDSLFVDNCLAMGGADLFFDRVPAEQVTYIFDNEPRNKEIVKRMYDVIEKDYNIVIWPDEVRHKDINDMVIAGLDKMEINDIISTNTCNKLTALTKLNQWKKV